MAASGFEAGPARLRRDLITCPSCANPLPGDRCKACGERFDSTLGIPDLRWPRPEPDQTEAAFVEEIVERFDSLDFAGLAEMVRRHHFSDYSEELLDPLRSRASDPAKLGRRMLGMFSSRLSDYYTPPRRGVALDIGCGYGTATLCLAREFDEVIALDPYLPVLLLGKKFLEEQGVEGVLLIQANAQNMPLRDRCIDYAVAQNVIEHLLDVTPALKEVERILAVDGCFCADSRNRYDLFFPEPHVHIRWVGVFPRAMQAWYVRKRLDVSYDEAHARLLSCWELKRSARKAFGDSVRVTLPLVSAYGQPRKLDRWIERMDRVPLLRECVLGFFPSHLLLAQVNEKGSSARSESRDYS